MINILINNNDYCGALFLLDKKEELSSIDKYNKCLCLFNTSSYEECYDILNKLLNEVTSLTEIIKTNFSVNQLELISLMAKPVALIEEYMNYPLYVLINIKWLLIIVLKKMNLNDKANNIARTLEKYKINLGE